MAEDTADKNTEEPKVPPIIKDGNRYILTNKKNVFVSAIEGLGFGWGLAVGVGILADLIIGLRKPPGTPDRFTNLVLSHSPWRQTLDVVGMAAGAAVMGANAVEHNKKIDYYVAKLQAEKIQQPEQLGR